MNQRIKYVLCFLLILCFLYYVGKSTYTSFESLISGSATNKTAGIVLKINGENVINANDVLSGNLILDNVTWTSTHTRAEKISPGSTGTISMELDPTGSEVAILYEFQFVDKVIDDDKLLTFGMITCDGQFVRTDVDTYSGIIPLSDVLSGRKIHITVGFYFDVATDIEGISEDNGDLDDLFEIHFHAIQYNGETIVPYNP